MTRERPRQPPPSAEGPLGAGRPTSLTYRRKGTVVAHRLDAPRDWVTTTGDPLHSDPGDWWVVGADGSERGVDIAEFPRLYEHIAADRYRRTGTVTARQATVEEMVTSFEGSMLALPGMWIVTAPPGNSWAVPDREFRSGYEPIDG